MPMVAAGGPGNQQFRADAVGGGDQHGVRKACGLEVEQAAEAAQFRRHAGPLRAFDQRLDGVHQGVTGVNIDACRLVTRAVSG